MRLIHKVILGFLMFLGFSAATAGIANAAVGQGDQIFSESRSCTIGYTQGNTAYSAAHCASNGDTAYDAWGNPVGTWNANHTGDPHTDVARIDTYDQTTGNPYSGDRVAPDWIVQPGVPICKQGAATGVSCGLIIGREGNLVHTIGAVPYPGDSGGPAWIPGVGYVGEATLYWPGGNMSSRAIGVDTGTYTRH